MLYINSIVIIQIYMYIYIYKYILPIQPAQPIIPTIIIYNILEIEQLHIYIYI